MPWATRTTYSATELGVKELPNSVDQTGEPGPPTSPPEVSEVSATPPSVSTCTEAQSVSVEVGASDPSGVNGVTVFRRTSGSQQLSAPATWTSGSAQKGQWSANLSLPAYAQEGEWKLSVQVSDSAGDLLYLSSAQLKSRDSSHFASSIQQTCIGDVTPPEVKGVEISPPTVDTSGKAREVTVKVHASDNLSGVASVTATLTDGSQQVSAPATLESTGTRLDGTWVATLVLPQRRSTGVWRFQPQRRRRGGQSHVAFLFPAPRKKIPDSIEQTGPGDETPPEINSGSVEPNSSTPLRTPCRCMCIFMRATNSSERPCVRGVHLRARSAGLGMGDAEFGNASGARWRLDSDADIPAVLRAGRLGAPGRTVGCLRQSADLRLERTRGAGPL